MRLPAFAVLAAATLLCAPAPRAAENDPTVATYHADAARSGHYVVPGLTWASAATMRRDAGFDGRVSGNVYAQPLYWHPPRAARGLVIVATEDNVVAALDAITGSTVWQRRLGPATPYSVLNCGNIDPLGITGTPVIDTHGGVLYLDAMVNGNRGPRHLAFGLSLADGKVLPGWPVDVADSLRVIGMTFDARKQNQRGALALVGDQLFIPYGGFYGLCSGYLGWVVGLRLDKPAVFGAWHPSADSGGIWAPGGIAYDGHDLFAVTNATTGKGDDWSGGNAVIRLPPDLRWQPVPRDFFAPAKWYGLGLMGRINPLPLDLPDGGPGSALLVALTGNGEAYLIDRGSLGGIGHPIAVQQVAADQVSASPAAYRDGHDMVVAFQAAALSSKICPDQGAAAKPGGLSFPPGLVALRISGKPQPAMHIAWCAALSGEGGAIVTTSVDTADPIVWSVGAEGDNRLHGFRGDTGQPVFASDPLPGLRHFVTILAAAGRLYVAGDGQVFAFGLPR
jgi:PQQ-like domain